MEKLLLLLTAPSLQLLGVVAILVAIYVALKTRIEPFNWENTKKRIYRSCRLAADVKRASLGNSDAVTLNLGYFFEQKQNHSYQINHEVLETACSCMKWRVVFWVSDHIEGLLMASVAIAIVIFGIEPRSAGGIVIAIIALVAAARLKARDLTKSLESVSTSGEAEHKKYFDNNDVKYVDLS